jgi:PKD repeat protein
MIRTLSRIQREIIFVSAFVTLVLLVGTSAVAAQSAPDCSMVTYNGDGTEANPYEVGNVDQLQCIGDQGLDESYVQVSDIDASGTPSWNGGDGFEPIGGVIDPTAEMFTGTYDGQGFEITGLTVNLPGEPNAGLFFTIGEDGEVTDTSVVNADITASSFAGGIAAVNGGTITESSVSGSIDDPNDAAVAGGLVAGNGVEGTIEESYSTASVNGGASVGGLAGENGGTIEKSYSTGSADGVTTGGLVGANTGTISESYATGSVSGEDINGGIDPFDEDGTVEKSYNTESVDSLQQIPSVVGGLVGVSDGTVTDSYWDTQTTGQSTSAEGTGLTTSEMTGSAATSNMQGFDFTTTWETVSGDYPILSWQTQNGDNTAPTASFTFTPSSPSTSDTVTFDASGSSDSDGSIQRYDWDFGDGNTATSTGETVTHTYSNTGTYTVELTVTDDEGATDTTTRTVTVEPDGGTDGSPVEDVSDELWTAVTGGGSLTLGDLGDAIQDYQDNPSDATVDGVPISLSDLGSLIQYYQNEVV